MTNSVSEEQATAEHIQGLIEEANVYFDEMCQLRHEMGAQRYGPVKFLEINSVDMAMEEVVDFCNYMRYTFIKLWLLHRNLQSMIPLEPPTLGATSFVPNVKDR